MTLVVTNELAKVLEAAEINTLHSRLNAIQKIQSNPMGIEVKTFGNATAFSARNIPGPSFNTVKGITDEEQNEVENIINYYKQKDIPVRLEITPAHVSSKFLTYLARIGFYQTDFHSTLFADLQSINDHAGSEILIRELEKDEFHLFAEIYANGFQLPAFLQDGIAQNNQVLHNRDGWTFYLASFSDQPAGVGVIFIQDSIATLAAAATEPSYRNNGIHQALISSRIQLAKSQGCKMIVGQARFGSISQNNMERAGMKIAYTKTIWVQK